MELIVVMVGIAALLSWKPLARLVPTESGLAFILVGIAMMAMLQAGWLE